jgi:hypothetical protein
MKLLSCDCCDYAPSASVLFEVLMYRTASKEFKYDHHHANLVDS